MKEKKGQKCFSQRTYCIKRDLSKKELKKIQKKTGLPTCDGNSFPFIKYCSDNASNWSPPDKNGNPKQCIITNPANTNLAPGSIYTCGFLW